MANQANPKPNAGTRVPSSTKAGLQAQAIVEDASKKSRKAFWMAFVIAAVAYAFMIKNEVPKFLCGIVCFFIALGVSIVMRSLKWRKSGLGMGVDSPTNKGASCLDFFSKLGSDKRNPQNDTDFIQEMNQAYETMNELKVLLKDIPDAWNDDAEK